MPVSLFICPSVGLFVCVPTCLSTCGGMCVSLFVPMSHVCVPVSLFMCLLASMLVRSYEVCLYACKFV